MKFCSVSAKLNNFKFALAIVKRNTCKFTVGGRLICHSPRIFSFIINEYLYVISVMGIMIYT